MRTGLAPYAVHESGTILYALRFAAVYRVLALLALVVACAPEPGHVPTESSLEILRNDSGFIIREQGRPVLHYTLAPRALDGKYERSNYVHPLYGLDGEILTEDFPDDHYHHRGVYWTWHQVLVGEVRAGDPWLAQRFAWKVEDAHVLPTKDGLHVRHRWYSPDFRSGREPILEETASVVVHPSERDVRKLDFDIRLLPLQDDVRLGGSEDDKGYGGFSVRVAMVDDLRFVAASGPVEPERLAMDLGDWVDFSGDFSGSGTRSGLAILVHPTSAGFPQSWILRSPERPSMQNPVWPGADPVRLERDEPVRLRYRLVVHRGAASGLDLAGMAVEYSALP